MGGANPNVVTFVKLKKLTILLQNKTDKVFH